MKKILLLGSGVSVLPLVDYFTERNYHLTIASRNKTTGKKLVEGRINCQFVPLLVDLNNKENEVLDRLVSDHAIVVSFLPGGFQPIVTQYCLKHGVSLVMTCHIGYLFKTEEEFHQLDKKLKDKNIAIVTEAGIDPGFGSMVMKKIIDDVHDKGGEVLDIWYHVGVLPHNANVNPFSYRCYWAPKKAIFASIKIKDGSSNWIKNSEVPPIKGNEVYLNTTTVEIPNIGTFESRSNSDSGAYLYPKVYEIENVRNFYQGTLRFPGWSETFQALIDLGFADDTSRPALSQMTYQGILKELLGVATDQVKTAVAQKLAIPLSHDIIKRFEWLGLFDNTSVVPPKGNISYCDIMADLLVDRLGVYQVGDSEVDQIIMYNNVLAQYPNHQEKITSIVHQKGEIGGHSICAYMTSRTAAMVARRLLEGSINITGLQYATAKEIYQPVLAEYAEEGIKNTEYVTKLMPDPNQV